MYLVTAEGYFQSVLKTKVASTHLNLFVCLRLISRSSIFQSFWDGFIGLTSTKQWEWSVLLKDTIPCPGWGSNPRPCDQESDTLPTELSVLPTHLKHLGQHPNFYMKLGSKIIQAIWLRLLASSTINQLTTVISSITQHLKGCKNDNF